MIVENAPAKINLALHVVGQRPDGYHLLQSLVTFAGPGDLLRFEPANQDEFSISGRFASPLQADASGKPNLVVVARDLLRNELAAILDAPVSPVHIHLEKNLPISSGIGGGSADAAAALRGLNRFWNANLPLSALEDLGIDIGADVPMCLQNRPLLAEGIGERLTPRPDLPSFAILLVNPLLQLSTPSVFKALARKTNLALALPATPSSRQAWIAQIKTWRNDLQGPAESLEPEIGETLHLLESTRPIVARMSGSGATCFGLYETIADAEAAKGQLATKRPDWYFLTGETVGGA